jgi:hypothetical protein
LGLRPGSYYVMAFKGSNLTLDITTQWHNGLPFDIQGLSDGSLWIEIPQGIDPVTVIENQYTELDIIFRESAIDNDRGTSAPVKFSLKQNYPNPFNPLMTVQYELPKKVFVDIQVFNMLGQRVISLVHKEQEAGIYQVQWDGSRYPSGVYFYRIKAGDYSSSKKCLLLK